MAEKLNEGAISAALKGLPDWRYDAKANALLRDFKFKDFSEAFGFMTRVALAAEAADHHPNWSNSYSKVAITLSTDTAGGVTEKDLSLARAIGRIVA